MRTWFSEKRVFLLRLTGTLLAIALLALLLKDQGMGEVLEAFRQLTLERVLLGTGLVLISRLFVVMRWYVLLRSADVKISLRDTTALTFSGLFASNFLPTTIGGDVVRLAGVMQMGFDRAVCLASIAADRLIGMLGMFIASPLGLIPAWRTLGVDMFRASVQIAFFQKAWDFVKRTLQTFSIWAQKPGSLLISLLCTLGHMAFTFLSLHVVIEGLASHVSFWMIAGVYSLAYFVTLMPISINGYGLQELSLTFLFSNVAGLSAAASLTVAVLIRAFYMISSLPGALYLPSILVTINQAKKHMDRDS
ncbi:MAG: lysylphosphatidylglycerol synthase transmembrane domain-containing protein [Anaerolineales bacterium]